MSDWEDRFEAIWEDERTIDEAVHRAVEDGMFENWRDVVKYGQHRGMRGDGIGALPEHVYEFIAKWCALQEPDGVLDPFAQGGELLGAILDEAEGCRAYGVTLQERGSRIAESILDSHRITHEISWTLADPFDGIEEVDGSYDIIATVPPFGLQATEPVFIESGESEKAVHDDQGALAAFYASLGLREDGKAIFLVPDGFFLTDDGVYENLGLIDLYPQAVISLPAGALALAGVRSNLLIAGRERVDQLFTAQLGSADHVDSVLQNLQDREEGSSIELGHFVEQGEFISWQVLELDQEIQQLARRSGLDETTLSDVATVRVAGGDDEPVSGDGDLNSVYLPRSEDGPVVSDPSELSGDFSRHLQIEFDSEKALAEYVVSFLESAELGELLRSRWRSGSQRLASEDLDTARMYLPPLEVQEGVLDTLRHIRDLQIQLQEAKTELWTRPIDVEDVQQSVERLNRERGLETWIESLPFPLASTLRRYYVSDDLREQRDILLNFFEALAEFLGTLMLSAFYADDGLFEEKKEYWLSGPDEGLMDLDQSDFGNWYYLAERLAKDTRRFLSGEDRDLVLELYGASSPSWIEGVIDKEIYKALEATNEYRNQWGGHGSAAVNESILKSQLGKLEDELARVRSALGDTFEDLILCKPGSCETPETNTFKYQIEEVMGAQMPFKKEEIKTSEMMRTGRLHLIEEGVGSPIELLPFVRVMPDSQTDQEACYFYNRIKSGNTVRWLSYHHEEDPDIDVEDEEIVQLVHDLSSD